MSPAPRLISNHFLSRIDSNLLAGIWLAVVFGALVFITTTLYQGYRFGNNILALLPKTSSTIAEEAANQSLIAIADKQLVILVSNNNPATSLVDAKSVYENLSQSKLFDRIDGPISDEKIDSIQKSLHPWRYFLIGAKEQKKLALNPDQLVNEALSRLYSPMAPLVVQSLTDDPLQLHFLWQLKNTPNTALKVKDGWLTAESEQRSLRVIRVELKKSAFDTRYQQDVLSALDEAQEHLSTDSQLLKSGLIVHSAYGAEQAKQEISTIGLFSVFGITVLLAVSFASIRSIGLALLPIATGFVIALAASIALFKEVHLITLAFGTSLLGVAIDYPMHFLCAQREQENAESTQQTLVRIFPGLTLGMISSVAAYLAQSAAPFPGLQQMAAFSAVGLFGAWFTVIAILPRLSRSPSSTKQSAYRYFAKSAQRWLNFWQSYSSLSKHYLLAAITAFSVLFAWNISTNDDVTLLQTSPQYLIKADTRIQEIMGADHPGQYFLVKGETVENLLLNELELTQQLNTLREQKVIGKYSAISSVIPPATIQRKNRRIQAEKIYSPTGILPSFLSRAGLTTLSNDTRQSFESSSATSTITPDQWLLSPAGEPYRHLWLGNIEDQYYSLVSLSGIHDRSIFNALENVADAYPAIYFIDRVDRISNTLQTYRHQFLTWLGAAYVIIFIFLLTQYGLDSWRALAAPAVATLITTAIMSALGIPFTIFHALALLLILGIGLDASIFMTESRSSPHTWIAITLSSMTTLLAFGLLMLSKIPVLHFFGQTVFIGIIAVWILTPLFIKNDHFKAEIL